MSYPDPAVAVAFQAIRALLLALLILQLGRAFSFRPARLWSFGWLALSIALASAAVSLAVPNRAFWAVYVFGEWVFLFLLWAGCRETGASGGVQLGGWAVAIPAGMIAAGVLASVVSSFDDLVAMDAAIIAIGSAAAALALRRAPAERRTSTWLLMESALWLMAVLYAAYLPIHMLQERVHVVAYPEYRALLDLLGGIFVGFSMILLIAEAERQQLQRAMAALNVARSEAEQRLHVDPLTEVLNRYAFHAMQRGDEIATEGSLAGVVAAFDIDNLKTINDQYGHTTGDHVIRAAASAIRNLVRAEDLLFRMGGDEFVVILPNFSAERLHERLRPLAAGIRIVAENGLNVTVHLSWGDAEFGPKRPLTEAIQIADAAMYDSRRNR